ncbi:MAG: hypothetical protein ACXVLQ_19290 [Bacteriovorax sp.]
MKQLNIQDTLFEYVTDKNKWFYWYHSPKRLEELYKQDHEKDPEYQVDLKCNFIKRRWRFKGKDVKHNDNDKDSVVIEENLADFFDAVLDEVRLKKANDFAEYALYISDNEDLAYFRNTAAKREVVADIDYNRQRDHAVHTLYNYLLGWYIFEYSDELQTAFRTHFEKLNIKNIKKVKNDSLLKSYRLPASENVCYLKNSMVVVHEFADVWHIASLLHDIGYILEGSLSSASPEVEHLRVKNGSKIIHDYFNHYFWKSFEIDFRAAKSISKRLGVVVPDFRNSESLASLGDRLCDIGSCENIRKKLASVLSNNSCSIEQPHGLNREAFSIWKEHYRFVNNVNNKDKKMECILYVVERVYKNWMWVGADYGKRNLDHGVCSGLITLQAMTFFRELFWGFCRYEWPYEQSTKSSNEEVKNYGELQNETIVDSSDLVSQKIFENIKKEFTHVPKRIRLKEELAENDALSPDFWFKKIIWATASAAIHSIVQKEEYTKECKKHFNNKDLELKIGFNDDPLAFLGVVVDVLQEWDRYKVTDRGEVAFSGSEPLQSTKVYLYRNIKALKDSCDNKKCPNITCRRDIELYKDTSIYLTYPKGDNIKNWTEALNKTMKYGLNVTEKDNKSLNVEGIVAIVGCSNNE